MTGIEAFFASLAAGAGTAGAAAAPAAAGTAAAGTAAAAGGGTLGTLATAASVGGTVLSGLAAAQQGKAMEAEAKRQATEERAIASRRGEERRMDTARVISRQKAVAASSGAGVTNPTILDIIGDTAQRGSFLERTETDTRARRAGQSAFAGSILEGIGTGAKALGNMRLPTLNDPANPRSWRTAPRYG